MLLPPRSILSLAIAGDDLHACRVGIGPFGAARHRHTTIEAFLTSPAETTREALRALGGAGSVVLTVPVSWCAIRQIPLTTKNWASARPELLRSIDRLVPFSVEEAIVGLMNIHDAHGRAESGRLIAIRRTVLAPWRRAIESALDRPINAVLAAPMSILGLGYQHLQHAVILDTSMPVETLRTTLAFGLPTEVAESVEPGAAGRDADHASAASDEHNSIRFTGLELAVGGALAPLVAPDAFAALDGATMTRRAEWIVPIAAFLAAAGLFIAAPMMEDARLRAGIERLKAEQAALIEPYNKVRDLRRETERLVRLLDEGILTTTRTWRSTLPAIAEAQAALPEDGFLYRLQIDDRTVTISGEASDAPAMLQRLEDSPLLESARRTGPLQPSSISGLDIFEMLANRLSEEGTP